MALLQKFRNLRLVNDETAKPTPTTYPPLLPTLQTLFGMVTNNGLPQKRSFFYPELDEQDAKAVQERAKLLRSTYRYSQSTGHANLLSQMNQNFQACALFVTKQDLISYIIHGKRIDTEQAVAMVIGYLVSQDVASVARGNDIDDFESEDTSVLDELINDPGTADMLKSTCMWRERKDYDLLDDPREAAVVRKKQTILRLLGEDTGLHNMASSVFVPILQSLRRKREGLSNTQYLTLPEDLLKEATNPTDLRSFEHSYRLGKQGNLPDTTTRLVSKSKFGKIHRLLARLRGPTDTTSRYVFDVERFVKASGRLSPRRMATLEASTDPYALAFGFMAAQRRAQLTVVSDQAWSRFLIKDEGKLLLQNRPDILTSFEDILVRRATDLTALTAVACPQGVKDNFSSTQEIKDRARGICEFMERYVKDFGAGKMDNLVFNKDVRGGSGRGPIDVYNKLCDELRDCQTRAKGAGFSLKIGPVYKFLAKDIMAWNKAWADDAFAGGKIPGWVEYLARVRGEEISLG